MQPEIYVIGASTRAAADMARRAGLVPGCFDSYCDVDLQAKAGWWRRTEFAGAEPDISPQEFQKIVGQHPWCYTGPLENCPGWLATAAIGTQLIGNPAESCLNVRDFRRLSAELKASGLALQMPELCEIHDMPADLAGWLVKPCGGTGGWEVQRASGWPENVRFNEQPMEDYLLQKFVEGPCFGATIASDGAAAVVLGVCKSIRGASAADGGPQREFAYAGSEGPVRGEMLRSVTRQLQEVSEWITRRYQLKGLWNIDLVYSSRERKWYLLEVNPRPSASMEVLELAAGLPLVKIMTKVFEGSSDWQNLANECQGKLKKGGKVFRKEIFYSPNVYTVDESETRLLLSENLRAGAWPERAICADIPEAEQAISAGLPIYTRIERKG